MASETLWHKFKSNFFFSRAHGFGLDISRMNFGDDFFAQLEPTMSKALAAMSELERGAIANPDEKRMVGHYWLRDSSIAPNAQIKTEIDSALASIKEFAAAVHQGRIANQKGQTFKHLLVVGIGGSALGPQFVSQALRSPSDPLDLYFFDNTDPDGMERVLAGIPDLSRTLCNVISKSGGTKETRNGMLIAKAAFEQSGLNFGKHAIATTSSGSELDRYAKDHSWLAGFPMWDWVGGRTSELSAVGLVPAALQGFNLDEMLRGAREMDQLTRQSETKKNPAALLSLMWYHAGKGRGLKDMVILPYKDRFELFSRYLQQLVMESLGKAHDLNGKLVNQGIAVYGNKGSTDQHAYVQQLRDGLNNFFAIFIEVLGDRTRNSKSVGGLEVEPGITSGDYLSGFFQGTRRALYESDRESVTITVDSADAHSIGMLIALFERTVGFYASLVNINAYHQPGVEAGKKAATEVLDLQKKVVAQLKTSTKGLSADELAVAIGDANAAEGVFKILRHLAANGRVKVEAAQNVFEDRYSIN